MVGDTGEGGGTTGKVFPVFRIFGHMNRRGKVVSSIGYGYMVDERAAYPGSSRRSEQLSCAKFFHPSYGLFYINFKRFKSFLGFI